MELFNNSGNLHPNLIIILNSMWNGTVIECLRINGGVPDKGTRLYEVRFFGTFSSEYKILDRR